MTTPVASPSATLAGLRGRCPRCGQGRLYASYLTVAPRCSHCGLDLSRHDSGDGPAVFVVLIVGFAVVGAALVVEVLWSPPLWVHLVAWIALATGLALALLPPFKGVLIALKIKHDAGEGQRDR
jgi:uncharacterized protein (DUF983 family)